ncbi:MAG: transketolase [Gammaproteobacteria bacterium]|uniref:transketolase n=1 Tax=Rhodoferax sp. TaxID=50421 RepID=UPI0018189BB4|nr:transketolase [Rhodoferax sp.]MBU3898243.1 transketolase [Gammaproteobacteria bacterium]MBA3059058.1 transketolase [Rhodoferax sp.]MBU3996993.1 transketolase [Gammaproteobacteria bacterium]MBU4081428.1 transketolase [Gammaproteobacteria bacterium]MBU4114207.1 transketolase [Gammaproteobacteria bacterium]
MAESEQAQASQPIGASRLEMANAIRALAMDAVQAANSGHPGAPMGMADMAVALWGSHLKHNPSNPHWLDRDRFVLSNGHSSMLLYAVLHLTGYKLPMAELKKFRQFGSKTPGHPEVGVTPGVETTTGPLGQGLTNAVGMALAEKLLAAEFNRDGHRVVNHHTYTFLGDGCLMEGISHEAVALAGAWKLNKLIALYDDNGISIDGPVAPWFIDNTALRFVACGWNVLGPIDGQDAELVASTIVQAKESSDKPTLIICKTAIGCGSPNRANTSKAHGEPLGDAEIALTREALKWPHKPFVVPKDVAAAWDAKAAGSAAEKTWNDQFAAYKAAYPELAKELLRRMKGDLPKNFAQVAVNTAVAAHTKAETVASRKASQLALESFTAALPELLGGSADLTGSNLTNTKATPNLRFDFTGGVVQTPNADGVLVGGRHINYGVREFGMAAIMNGIALHGGFIPYGGTFLTFSDYSRNAIRMAALMKLRVVHVFTHDSIGLGEDGPTHQSIEHAASLRLIPNLDVWRPGDTAETAVAWAVALQNKNKPTALLLSRQNIHYAPKAGLGDISKGAYILAEPSEVGLKKKTQAVLIATGSEVQLALKAQEILAAKKIAVRVVSMPSTTTFDEQSGDYKAAVLPVGVPRIAVEMGVSALWWKYGCAAVVGIDSYGESAPAPVLFEHFGFTAENVADTVEKVLRK